MEGKEKNRKLKIYGRKLYIAGVVTGFVLAKTLPMVGDAVISFVNYSIEKDNLEYMENAIEYNRQIMTQRLERIKASYEQSSDPVYYFMMKDAQQAIEDGTLVDLYYEDYVQKLEDIKEESKGITY